MAVEDRTTCTPCRGTGAVISGKGGDPHQVPCPWCEGTGRYPGPEHDAQAARREDAASAPASG